MYSGHFGQPVSSGSVVPSGFMRLVVACQDLVCSPRYMYSGTCLIQSPLGQPDCDLIMEVAWL